MNIASETPATRAIDVACAVIVDTTGAVLLAKRPPHVPYAGFWEFPGGKFERGEDAHACLVRELREELAIEVGTTTPWLTRVFTYPDKTVRLHFLRVHAYSGEPRACEGQTLAWQPPHAVSVAPLLEANAPILQALALPPVYAITQAQKYGVDVFLKKLDAALARGVRLIQIREKDFSATALRAFAEAVIARARPQGARVLVNGDVALAQRIGADGVHLTATQLATTTRRPDLPLCAASCHDARELDYAARMQCDFAVLSPVLPTASHPETAGLGWEKFAALIKGYSLPVYALGGMRTDLLDVARRQGAHGIAVLSGAWVEL